MDFVFLSNKSFYLLSLCRGDKLYTSNKTFKKQTKIEVLGLNLQGFLCLYDDDMNY